VTLDAATHVSDDLRRLWAEALDALGSTRGGPELLEEVLPRGSDPLGELVGERSLYVERREGAIVGFAIVRGATVIGLYVTPSARGTGVAREMALALFALREPPRDALALPGDRATKSLYESLGLKARLLTMRAE
jgi:GNAT superfamily N-acetyltransferase